MKISKKIIIIGIAGIGILILTIFLFMSSTPTADKSQTQFTPIPTSVVNVRPTIPQTETMLVANVEIKNVYKEGKTLNTYGEIQVAKTPEYEILYEPADEAFLIGITSSPFESTRPYAESAFLKLLDITPTTACTLKVTITTPFFINPDHAGNNYRLSFCKE